MIQRFVDAFMAKEKELMAWFSKEHPKDYEAIVRRVIEAVTEDDDLSEFHVPDPERIHVINDGEYQGTLVFVIGAKGYQPSEYWAVRIYYGSCSGCDTLQGIGSYDDDPPTPEQAREYWTLALHIVQGIKVLFGDAE